MQDRHHVQPCKLTTSILLAEKTEHLLKGGLFSTFGIVQQEGIGNKSKGLEMKEQFVVGIQNVVNSVTQEQYRDFKYMRCRICRKEENKDL